MLKRLAHRYFLVLKKDQTFQIIIQLFYNMITLFFFKFEKVLKRTKRPIIHYYALCWNEEKMLPFVFNYYNDIVDKFIIYDNFSNDSSVEIISKNNKAQLIQYSTEGKFNDDIHVDLKNNIWKQSRGKADYVIVCDIDEFLYHPLLNEFLQNSFINKYSFFEPYGYEMYSELFPQYVGTAKITDIVKTGFFSSKYSKSIIFDPHYIVEINYSPGAHYVAPLGIVKRMNTFDLKLLHYKNLSLENVLNRIQIYRSRLSNVNKEKGYGIEYLKEIEVFKKEFTEGLLKSTIVI